MVKRLFVLTGVITVGALIGLCFSFHSIFLVVAVLSLLLEAMLVLVLKPPILAERSWRNSFFDLSCNDDSPVWIWTFPGSFYLPWYNAVIKEIGSCRLFHDMSSQSKPRVIILPHGTILAPPVIEILRTMIENGVSVLCECPNTELEPITGLVPDGSELNCARHRIGGKTVDLTGAKARGYRNTYNPASGKAFDDVLLERRIGKGTVFILTVFYSQWVMNITQGKPNRPGGRFHKKLSLDMQGMQTPDLRTDSPPSVLFEPVLDWFDAVLFARLRDQCRLPSWWYYPDDFASAFILTFDEDWHGKKAQLFPPPGIPSSWFVVDDSGLDDSTVRYIRESGGEIQFHWNRFILHLTQFGWHFCPRSAQTQRERLAGKIKDTPRICRIHYLRWDADFDNLFYVMKEAGLEVDSSFGPGRDQHGYRFGTGFPYWISGKDGTPVGILETPFQIHEPMGGRPLSDHLRLLEESIRDHHTIIVGLYHPYYCLPGKQSHEAYQGVLKFLQSNKKQIWCTNLGVLTDFWNKRQETAILSSWNDHELTLRFNKTDVGGMTLRLPDVEHMETLDIDGHLIPPRERVTLQNSEQLLRIKYCP
ncbi:hypothetical protein ACFLQR_04030 [Verrucomicrobiota bacterium]